MWAKTRSFTAGKRGSSTFNVQRSTLKVRNFGSSRRRLDVERWTLDVHNGRVKFSIVTPSLRQLTWLKRCVRSVADQGADVEHLIQDAGTGAELEDWVRANSTARLAVETDSGMYDALNRGFARATGEICAWLNCDEQYLPGTLAKVRAIFEREPETDWVVGDHLLIGADGALRSFRRATRLRPAMILTDHLYDLSCAMFFRRRLLDTAGSFRADFRAAGDAEWVCRALRTGARVRYVRAYLAAFTLTAENLSQHADPAEEARKLRALTPRWAQLAKPLLREWRHVEKWLAGGYSSLAIAYEIFAAEDDQSRTRFVCEHPAHRHPWADRI